MQKLLLKMQKNFSKFNRSKIFEQILKEIKEARSIIIAAHQNPDPDAIGSTVGLWEILKDKFPQKNLWPYNPTPLQKRYWVLEGAKRIKNKPPRKKFDLLIVLDAGNLDRIQLRNYILRYKPKIIYIDHHENSNAKANIVWIEKDSPSTSELIYELAKNLKWPISKDASQALLIGIAGDTLNFSIAPQKTFAIAAQLMKKRPNFSEAIRHIFGWPSLNMMYLFGKALLRAKFLRKKRLIWSYISQNEIRKYHAKAGELAYIANSLRNFSEAEVSLFLRPQEDGIWEGSLRSALDHPTNLAELAEKFNGGGHFHAAGFKTALPLDKILKEIISMLPERK